MQKTVGKLVAGLAALVALMLVLLSGPLGEGYEPAHARELDRRWLALAAEAVPSRPAEGPALLELADELVLLGEIRIECPEEHLADRALDRLCAWLARPGPKRLGAGWSDPGNIPITRHLVNSVCNLLRSGRADRPEVREGLWQLTAALWIEPVATNGLDARFIASWLCDRERQHPVLGAERIARLIPDEAARQAAVARLAVAILEMHIGLVDQQGPLGLYVLGRGKGVGPFSPPAWWWRDWMGELRLEASPSQRGALLSSFQASLLGALEGDEDGRWSEDETRVTTPAYALAAMVYLPPGLLERQADQRGVAMELDFLRDSWTSTDRCVAELAALPMTGP